jgi:hypothetical protein
VRLRELVTVVALAVAYAPAGAAPTVDQIESARSAVMGDELQRELPGVGSDANAGGPAPKGAVNQDGTIDTREQTSADGFGYELGLFSDILRIVMYLGVIVGTVLLGVFLAAELGAVNHDVKLPDDGPRALDGPDMAVIERPLADAEELARRGEYREAIHTLLLRTLRELVRSTAVRVPASLTSREILGRVPLHDEPRAALAQLITAVELTHFGSDDATVDDYARCRAQFQVFATSFQRAGARA